MSARRRLGSLLIMSLWLVAILSILAVAVARSLSVDIRLAKYRQAHDEARALARSGIYLAMQQLARDAAAPEADGKVYDWLGDEWAGVPGTDPDVEPGQWLIRFPGTGRDTARFPGEVRIRVADEAGKLHLNTATKEQLVALTDNEMLAQEILDARDGPDPAEDRPDDATPYFAKNGPFAAPAELSDLPGMTPEAYDTLQKQASPYTPATAPININTVTPDVLDAVGLSGSAVSLITRFREGTDGPDAHEQDGVFTEAGLTILQVLKDAQGVDLTGTPDGNLLTSTEFGVSSDVFTIVSEGAAERPAMRCRVEAVVRRAGCSDGAIPPCIVAWREG